MAVKKCVSSLLTCKELDLVERLCSTTNIPKSAILSFTLELLTTYFTEDQLRAEAEYFTPADGRRNED